MVSAIIKNFHDKHDTNIRPPTFGQKRSYKITFVVCS